MLGFAALAEVALAEIPNLAPAPVPPPVAAFARAPTGKVVIIDVLPAYRFGHNPKVNESCVLIINVAGLFNMPVLLFTAPSGVQHFGDKAFTYIGHTEIVQNYIPNFPSNGYLVYTIGVNELDETGQWRVQILVEGPDSENIFGTYTIQVDR